MNMRCKFARVPILFAVLILSLVPGDALLFAQSTPVGYPSISRPVRSWEFLPVVGQKAAILGNESGRLEAWVYPIKLFRDFTLIFHADGRSFPAATLARNLEVRPESATITYANESFLVRETIFVPREEQGAIISLDVDSHIPVTIEARFHRDFQLMWPAGLGATYGNWDDKLHAFRFGEEQKKWFGLIGSPQATQAQSEFDTNYFNEPFDSFELPPSSSQPDRRLIAISGSTSSAADAESTYQRLVTNYDQMRDSDVNSFANYLGSTASLELPDPELQRAYDWARISVLQGVVTNPFLGTGLIAGYRTSGAGARPGFAWFFGRDSEWTSFALDSEGYFQTSREALDFISKYQREDGKIPHEISQAAKQVPWFTAYPYPWASADATPLFIIAVRDYYDQSGDSKFVTSHWDNVWRAYQFLRSTWDEQGLPRNLGIGHGWVEGGPLVPVKTEFYQSGLGVEALNALATLARVAGKADIAEESARLFAEQRTQLNSVFWNDKDRYFAYAIDVNGRRADTPSVLTTVPMWFGLTDPDKTEATITHLADADQETDWGMRIISARDHRFDPSGYHFGSVWPLFTGWASVAEYRYHRPLPAFDNLRANAMLTLNGSAGHTTEVLSGSYFEPLSTSSPHQIWSSAMVITPTLRGLLGISASSTTNQLTVAPHLPGDWTWWRAKNIRFGGATVDIAYTEEGNAISFDVVARNAAGRSLELSPALSPHAHVTGVTVNGRSARFDIRKNATDQHVRVVVPLAKRVNVRINVTDDFHFVLRPELPPLGSTSQNLRIISETWSADGNQVTYELAGISGRSYDVQLRGTAIGGVDGARITPNAGGSILHIGFSGSEPGYQHSRVTIRFGRGTTK